MRAIPADRSNLGRFWMNTKVLIVTLISASLLAGPSFAGAKSMKMMSSAQNNCKALVKAKKVAKADYQTEYNKCLDNPTSYQ
jgi:hypothetical protein